jgi:hypothetical protein
MNRTDLPVRPDRDTGEPRPPEAPLRAGWSPGNKASQGDVPPFESPPGHGPVLEWYQHSRATSWWAAAFGFGVLALFATFKVGGLEWLGYWWLWVIVLLTMVLLFFGVRGTRLSAGADWLRGKKGWVSTYELTRIKATRAYATIAYQFTDAGDRHLYMTATDLQENPRLWDLVYNGILHSVYVNQAEANSLARKTLHLDD